MLRRILAAVPPGTLAVGSGLAVLGVASYAHLAAAGHSLDHADMSSMSVLWSLVYAIGLGVFFPLEQEITRLVAGHRVAGGGAGPVLRRGAALAGGMLVVLLVAIGVASPWLSRNLFGGDTSLVWALGGGLVAEAVAHTSRGVLAGRARFGAYGSQLAIDGGLRIVVAALLAAAGTSSAFWFGALLTLTPLASVALTLPAVRAEAGHGEQVGWREFGRGLTMLVVSALAAQVVANIAVINVRLLDPSDTTAAAAMLSAVVLVRIPLFVFASVQASLLPGLTTAVVAGRMDEYRRLLARTLGLVTALGVVGGVICVAVGPPLVIVLFDAPRGVLGAADFAWLAVGTLAYLWALVLGQGVLARGRHRDQTVAWVVGTAVLVGVTLVPGSITTRVELGYALGAAAVAALLAVLSLLAGVHRAGAPGEAAPLLAPRGL